MAAKEFAEYKYDAGMKSSKGLINFLVLLSASVICVVALNFEPMLLALLLIPLAVFIINSYSSSTNIVLVGTRYLVVGGSVVYYANVSSVSEDRQRGVLSIVTEQGRTVKILADKFPTGARKPEKIKKNKDAKFAKTAEKILARIGEIAPHALKKHSA